MLNCSGYLTKVYTSVNSDIRVDRKQLTKDANLVGTKRKKEAMIEAKGQSKPTTTPTVLAQGVPRANHKLQKLAASNTNPSLIPTTPSICHSDIKALRDSRPSELSASVAFRERLIGMDQ